MTKKGLPSFMWDGFFCEEYGCVFAFFNKSLEIFLEKSLV